MSNARVAIFSLLTMAALVALDLTAGPAPIRIVQSETNSDWDITKGKSFNKSGKSDAAAAKGKSYIKSAKDTAAKSNPQRKAGKGDAAANGGKRKSDDDDDDDESAGRGKGRCPPGEMRLPNRGRGAGGGCVPR